LDAALKHGFSEAIFLNSLGLLTEGTGSNLFIVKSGQILTPRIENGLLPGITRQLVIDWVSPNLELKEVDLTQSDLFSADEIFITSSTRNVHPVSRIAQLTADLKVNSEKTLNTGIVTSEVVSIFNKNSKEQVNP
jgi:branched-chain amino acid aminotransferase